MSTTQISDNCEAIKAYLAFYHVPLAAALWCGMSAEDATSCLVMADTLSPGIRSHPKYPCLEHRCRVIHEAISSGKLPCTREKGKVINEHVAPERRHVSRTHLKAWISEDFPDDKPEFLFDEIERQAHPAINKDSFLALQVDRDALQTHVNKLRNECDKLSQELAQQKKINQSFQHSAHTLKEPDERAEKTYLNIIGALLDVITKGINIGPATHFESEARLIAAIAAVYVGISGMSESNLQRKFPQAKRSINTS